MAHRLPRYRAIAERWGVTVEADEIEAVRDPQDFVALVAAALGPRERDDLPLSGQPHRHRPRQGHGHRHRPR